MERDYVWISVGNYFTEQSLEEVKQELEKGQKVEPIVNCIGHTRNNMVQEEFKKALEDYYKERLIIELDEGWCSYSYKYKLMS